MRKRIMSLLLAVCMVMAMLPVEAFAAVEDGATPAPEDLTMALGKGLSGSTDT